MKFIENSDYNKDNMPEKKPETEEEHYKAAAKYGMHPDEYESYPDDGWNYRGDYPKLPFVGNATKDPYYPWDNPVYRRNFNEPVSFVFVYCFQGHQIANLLYFLFIFFYFSRLFAGHFAKVQLFYFGFLFNFSGL